MFTAFFYLLRSRGLKVSMNEWMTLMEALDKGLHQSSFTGFYYLCRSVLVKSEADFDKFDGAFLEFFKGVEFEGELPPELMDWLTNPKEKPGDQFDMERAMQNEWISQAEIQKMFLERLEEQKEEHNGGSYWVGTGGVSVFGNSGFSPRGIRVGGEGGKRRAFQVASERKFRDFRQDNTLDTRQFQMAFRRLRQFSAKAEEAKTEFDIDGTIRETCDNAGKLKVVYDRPRKNTVKVLLLMDSGGSMDYYSRLCSMLFQSVSKSNHFKDLQVFYFHNCIYSKIYTDPQLRPKSVIPTDWILKNLSSEYKVIIVGDAQMEPSELLDGSYYNYGVRDNIPGIEWLTRFREKYPHLVWLNPSERPYWGGWWAKTYDIIHKDFDMYDLSIDGLNAALKKLMVNR
ncbi:vWA domain-containing protein [Anaerotignum sp.]|uniref:vWA domain-containing protein n=1 Tax=Anaerotignum sp. TaxID=2039241 RepID=UPI002A912C6D|nr:VWA domain-containing protein [Anaerotignum sp.]MCI7658157.1 VWA domain-containing protein [Clostridia bacterium]MDY5414601.1 VWA domain-containing protein [Anaerotignum sp.]